VLAAAIRDVAISSAARRGGRPSRIRSSNSPVFAKLALDRGERRGSVTPAVLDRRADHTTGVRDDVGDAEDAPFLDPLLRLGGGWDVRALQDHLRAHRIGVAGVEHVRLCRGHEHVAFEAQHGVARHRPAAGEVLHGVLALVRRERRDVEPGAVVGRAAAVGHRDHLGAALVQPQRGVPADRAEPLNDDRRAVEVEPAGLVEHLRADGEPEAGRAELVERDPAEHRGQAGGPVRSRRGSRPWRSRRCPCRGPGCSGRGGRSRRRRRVRRVRASPGPVWARRRCRPWRRRAARRPRRS
jgi:hypothetical protein